MANRSRKPEIDLMLEVVCLVLAEHPELLADGGVSREALADVLGCTHQNVAAYEYGARDKMRAALRARALAEARGDFAFDFRAWKEPHRSHLRQAA